MLNFLVEPWQYEFMRNAIAIGILVGILCPVVGSYPIVQRMALFYTFDRTGAEAIGLPVRLIYLGFMSAITLTIIASMQAVGVILVISLLVGSALTAYLLVKELHQMMILVATIGAFASLSGIYISFYLKHVPSDPEIVIVSSGLFILALLFSPSQGILTQRFRLPS